MKKTLALAACIMSIMAVFTACNTNDGKVNNANNTNNNNTASTVSRVDNVYGNDTALDRTTDVRDNNSRVVTNDREVIDNNNGNDGVIHDVGSMVGTGIEDAADGIENIGSSVASNISDATHDDEYRDNM